MQLYIGNKNYSSWSMRPWLVLRAFDVPFEEVLVPLDTPEFAEKIAEISGAGRVPVLVDGAVVVWESLAIIEYIAERHSGLDIWPRDVAARAHARAAACEMHAGFGSLRNACPMNLAKTYAKSDRGSDVASDVARIVSLWRSARDTFGKATDQPFLYGAFCAADAMYAPVVARFVSYQLTDDAVATGYMRSVTSHAAYAEWRQAGLREPWVLEMDEVDEPAIEDLRSGSNGPVTRTS
jgi:glutathione S-transferase